jgi:hypothetical protein
MTEGRLKHPDYWYIRFPDGRILRAVSTVIVRQELEAGHIPHGSTVRRSPDDEWTALAWTQEFADLVERLSAQAAAREAELRRRPADAGGPAEHAATVGSRIDPSRLHFVGVRDHLGELVAALDSTFVARKLLLGLVAGLFLGGVLALQPADWWERDSGFLLWTWIQAGVGVIVLAFLTALLTRLTYVELSRLRPARWSDALPGIGRLTIRTVITQAILLGATWGLIVLLRWLPYWLGPGPDDSANPLRETAAGAALALGMVLEAGLWAMFFLWWLLPPILVVEECSVWRGLRQWLDLLRKHFRGVLLYQVLALGLGALLAVPFLMLIAPLFLPSFYPPEGWQDLAEGVRFRLLVLACFPMLTYWIVANVFIYLNLRYGAGGRH